MDSIDNLLELFKNFSGIILLFAEFFFET